MPYSQSRTKSTNSPTQNPYVSSIVRAQESRLHPVSRSAKRVPVDTAWYFTFANPTGALETGANLQQFRIGVRKSLSTGHNPTLTVELWESGVKRSTLLSASPVSSGAGQVVTLTWDAALLNATSGLGVELKIFGKASADASIELESVRWDSAQGAAVKTLTLGFIPSSEQVYGPVIANNYIHMGFVGSPTPIGDLVVGDNYLVDDLNNNDTVYGPTFSKSAASISLTGSATPKAKASATPSLSYALTGSAKSKASSRGMLSVNYAASGSAKAGAKASAAPSVSYALSGQAKPRAKASAIPSASYALSGVAKPASKATAASAVTYALVGQAKPRVKASATQPSLSYALTAAAKPGAKASAALSVSYALVGVASCRTRAQGSVSPSGQVATSGVGAGKSRASGAMTLTYALSGVAKPKSKASATPIAFYALSGVGSSKTKTQAIPLYTPAGFVLVGVASPKSKASGILGVTYALSGRATSRTKAAVRLSIPLVGVARCHTTARASFTPLPANPLYPDAILSSSGYSGLVSVLRDDPEDVADETWLTVV